MITPIKSLRCIGPIGDKNVFAKLEGFSDTKSMKIRSAEFMLEPYEYRRGMTFLESTSGNMGVALAHICERYGHKCVLVVDPKLSPWHQQAMLDRKAQLIAVETPDETGGWLKTRLRMVKSLLEKNPNWVWLNQYENRRNPKAFEFLAEEIQHQLDYELEKASNVYLFMSVSTGGSLSGLARGMKKLLKPGQRLITVAVDAKGSAVFGQKPEKRFLNGIGSSLADPPNLDRSLVDQVIIISDVEAFLTCYTLRKQGFYVGGSSGAVCAAVSKVQGVINGNDLAIAVFPDAGEIYEQTIYSQSWMLEHVNELTRET